jgi:hypothetical protein
MKCAVAFSVLFAGSVLLLGESRTPPVLDEIVRMTKSGASDVSVLAYARAHRLELPEELSVAALQWLRGAGVSERVVSYMSAIDVRAPSLQAAALQDGVTYSEGEQGRPAPRHPAYVSSEEDAAQPAGADQGNSGTQASGRYDSGFASDDLYPYWGYTYPGPYYVYPSVVIDQGNPFQPAHGGRGNHPGHHGQPGHHRSDGWRDRAAGHGHSSGSAFSATRRAPGNAAASRGFRASSPSPSMTAGRTPPAMRGPRNGSGTVNGFRSFGPSAGARTATGGTSPRAPVVARGGAGVSAPAGGRGRH